jgi:hypothetical protein
MYVMAEFTLAEVAKHIRELVATNHAVTLPDALEALARKLEAACAPAVEAVSEHVEMVVAAVEQNVSAEQAGEDAEAVKAALTKTRAVVRTVGRSTKDTHGTKTRASAHQEGWRPANEGDGGFSTLQTDEQPAGPFVLLNRQNFDSAR